MPLTPDYYVWNGSAQDGSDATWNSASIAYVTLEAALAVAAAGETIAVASEHSQTQAVSLTLTSNGTRVNPITIISLDKDNGDAYLPMIDDAAPGDISTTDVSSDITPPTNAISMGLHFVPGDDLTHRVDADWLCIDCFFEVEDYFTIGETSGGAVVEWRNCNYKQLTAGNFTVSSRGKFTWRGGVLTFGASGAIVTGLVELGTMANICLEDLDLTVLDSGDSIIRTAASGRAFNVLVKRCKKSAASGFINGTIDGEGGVIRFHSVSESDIIYQLQENYFTGQINDETGIYYDAQYAAASYFSIKMVTNAYAREYTKPLRYKLPGIYAAANPTITVEFNIDQAAALQNDEVWLEVEYPDGTIAALGNVADTLPTTIQTTTSDLTSSSVSWTGTEGFSNEQRRKISITISGGSAGIHTVWVCCGLPSVILYVNPKLVIS